MQFVVFQNFDLIDDANQQRFSIESADQPNMQKLKLKNQLSMTETFLH